MSIALKKLKFIQYKLGFPHKERPGKASKELQLQFGWFVQEPGGSSRRREWEVVAVRQHVVPPLCCLSPGQLSQGW